MGFERQTIFVKKTAFQADYFLLCHSCVYSVGGNGYDADQPVCSAGTIWYVVYFGKRQYKNGYDNPVSGRDGIVDSA